MTSMKRAVAVCLIAISAVTSGVARAQTAYLQSSGIVGEGTKLYMSRVPVANANGQFSYDDVTISFGVNAAGSLAQVGRAKVVPSATPVTSNFVAGRYYVKYSNSATQFGTLSVGVGAGGTTIWSLVMDQAPDGDFPDQASWQTETPAPDVAARLAAAKVVLDPNESYGTFAVGDGRSYSPFHISNGLLGAQQVGSNLTLKSYTYNADQSSSAGSITLVLCGDSACSNSSN